MKHITTGKRWLFEIKAVRAIRVDEYGKPFDATVRLEIVDGELHFEGLLAQDFTKSDWSEIESHIKGELGFSEYFYSRFKNGKRKKIKKVIR